MKLYYLIIIFLVVSNATSFSQQFVQEWEISERLTYVGDIDGDGVGEFVIYDENNLITKFYEFGNLNVKWTITDKKFEENIYSAEKSNLQPDYLEFPSIDYNGDGKREVIFEPSDGKGILIVDVVNNTNVFEWLDSQISYAGFKALSDVDGDGELELVFGTTIENYPNPNIYKTYVYSTGVTTSTLENPIIHQNSNYQLQQNYPNPFNPSTKIEYSISEPSIVSINIFNINGELIKEVVNEEKNTGNYSVIWNGKDNKGNIVASGTYFYQIQVGDFVQAKKMILLK